MLVVVMCMALAKRVILHVERFGKRHSLLHTAISFQGPLETRRFDFRMGDVNGTYLTTAEQRSDLRALIPGMHIPESEIEAYADFRHEIDSSAKQMVWGETDRSWGEIMAFEQTLCHRYILGIYDCRHYVNAFSRWSTGTGTPIWRLHLLYRYL